MDSTASRTVKQAIIAVICLITVEQGIKLVIARWYMEANIEIWPGVLRFRPLQNVNQTWFGSMGVPFMDSTPVVVVLNALVLWLGIRVYGYWLTVLKRRGRLVQTLAVLFFAGAICSFIDSLFWDGFIDYIRLFTWFTFDLKDCYISAVLVLIVISVVIYSKELDELDLGDIGRYCLMRRRDRGDT